MSDEQLIKQILRSKTKYEACHALKPSPAGASGSASVRCPCPVAACPRGVATALRARGPQVLGLSTTCTEEEVQKAYRRLALRIHPDKCKAPKAQDAFAELDMARTFVLDALLAQQRRREGDAALERERNKKANLREQARPRSRSPVARSRLSPTPTSPSSQAGRCRCARAAVGHPV